MEAVLDTYAQSYDPRRPVICFDEKSYQLLDHVRDPLPPVPGHPARVDHEYKRCGTVNFFVAFEPLTGQRTVTVTERRANGEFTAQLQALELRYAEAEKITLVLDQLSTHSSAVSTSPGRGSASAEPTLRVDLHAKTCVVAQHG